MDTDVTFGAWLKHRRCALDLTQKELARQVSCAVITLRKFESNKRRPSKELAQRLALCLFVPPEDCPDFIAFARGGPLLASINSRQLSSSVKKPSFLTTATPPAYIEQNIFVAREHELARLNGFLGAALVGRGGVAFIIGEAGSGKTALLQEFTRQACQQQTNLVVAGGNGNAYSGLGDPYLPFREILNLLTGEVETRWEVGGYTRRLWNVMPCAVSALVDVGPDLIDVFISGKALVKRAEVAAPPGAGWLADLQALLAGRVGKPVRTDLQQSDLFAQYTRVLQRLARQQPLLLILDDLQWADNGSISLLFHLGRQLQGSPILLVGAYRPGEVALGRARERHPLEPVLHEFTRYFGDMRVDLARSKGRQFIDAFLDSEPNRLEVDFRQTLYNVTKGHALFTVEMLRGMQARGDLVQEKGGCWAAGPALDWETLPARVEGVIAERIHRLPPDLREMFEVAAVEGEEFTAEVVAQVQGVEQWQVVQGMSGSLGQRYRLVNNQGSRRVGANQQRISGYRFRHILFQRYLYANLDVAKRSYLHEAVGNALEQFYIGQTEAVAVQLARHFQEAGLAEKAVSYLLEAGQHAARLSAYEEAIVHFTNGLKLLATLPTGPERNRQELLLQTALGNMLIPVKGYGSPDVEHAFSRAWVLCRQADDSLEIFPVLYGLWVFNYVRAELQAALELAQRFLNLAQRGQAKEPLLVAHHVMGITLFNCGEIAPAKEHLEQCIALYNPQLHHALTLVYGQDPQIASLSHLALSLWLLGYPDSALKTMNKALSLAQKHPQLYNLAFALTFAAIFYQFCDNAQAAEKKAAAAIELSDKQGFVVWSVVGTGLHGWALAELRHQEKGLAQMTDAFNRLQTIGSEIFRPYFLALLGGTNSQEGKVSQALAILSQARAIAEQTGDRFWEAEIHRIRGAMLPNNEEAEACFFKAIEVAQQQEAKSLELRAVTSLSRLWLSQGKQAKTRQMLSKIYGWFTEGFDTPDLQEARALLAQASSHRRE